ncbi:reverse transcriptase domain-containing protein, partial [Mesorhizobium sp. M0152]|uniref:reverse transcriptase domain-containing protein n=1 Tax=Mesorhizobium sp. M0152 TaxID=2956898 RepID=UPI0033398349
MANIYLHYVLDLWAQRWRQREATGDMIIVRYADDVVVGFEHEGDARRFLEAMRARLEEFLLSLHPDKTRLIEFGRLAAANRKQRGLGKPETFAFLGFTFICGKSRRGHFQLQRKTRGDRIRAKLQDIKVELRRRMHWPIPKQGKVAKADRDRPLRIFRGSNEYPGAHGVQVSGDRHLEAYASAAQPEGRRYVGTDCAVGQRLPSQALQPSSMAECPFRRQTLEVGAECPNWARSDLCGGR